MIGRLVRTELESYLHDLVVWGGAVFLLLMLFLAFMGVLLTRFPLGDPTGLFLAVGLTSVLLAVRLSRRNALEKQTRLFAQLPVSTRDVSVAGWCVRLVCLAVPVLACAVLLARAAGMSLAPLLLVVLATYLGATTLVAAISVAMTIPHLPAPLSAWVRSLYVVGVVVTVVLWIAGNLVMWPMPGAIRSLADTGLPGLTACLLVSGVGLVLLDVWLRERADDYLG